MKKVKVGVLALQGAVREHLRMLNQCKVQGLEIKRAEQLAGLDALIIPGGESTTIGKLMVKYQFVEPIRKLRTEGLAIYGTCAGLILLAKKVVEGNHEGNQTLLELMNIEARRNAFGRQRESFETDLNISGIGGRPFRSIFIRAPWIESVWGDVEILSRFKEKPVMAKQDRMLVTAFHPELTEDIRVHQYFISMIEEMKN